MRRTHTMRQTWFAVLLAFTLAWTVSAQDAISAKAGMVNYFEGSVELDGQPLEFKRATFHQIPEGGKLYATAQGRAEVLLSPGVLLWLGESSEIELVSSDLADARVRLLGGSVVVSGSEFPKDVAVTVLVKGDQIRISQSGIFTVDYRTGDYSTGELAVHEGRVDVSVAGGSEIRVKKGRTLALNQPGAGLAKLEKDADAGALMLWARSRDHHIQVANVSAARQIQTQGMGAGMSLGMLGAYRNVGSWFYNPYFGMYTYVPFGSGFMNPWGSYLWTPRTVGRVYAPSYGGVAIGRGGVPRETVPMTRSGFSDSPAFGSYSRGASVGGGGSYGGSVGGGFSRGASSVGGGSVGSSSPSTSSSGASMGRGGGATAGRSGGGGGGRGN